MTLSLFDIAAVLILLAAALGYLNHRFLKLPSAVGLTLMGAVASLLIIGLGALFPGSGLTPMVEKFLTGIDFHATLMEGMLSFLLFAGALHVDWSEIRANRVFVFAMATFEVMISLAVVMGGYSLSHWLHVSGPVAMAVAGLFIGNTGVAQAMSDVTQDYLIKFWELIDEVLNAVLFLLIGLEVILITRQPELLLFGLLAIPLALAARWLSVSLPLTLLRARINLGHLAVPTLVWGGLRGGISIALALSLPDTPYRTPLVAATFVIVLFSVIIQGGSIGGLIHRLGERQKRIEGEANG